MEPSRKYKDVDAQILKDIFLENLDLADKCSEEDREITIMGCGVNSFEAFTTLEGVVREALKIMEQEAKK